MSFFPSPAALELVIEIDQVFGLKEWLLSNSYPCWGFNQPNDRLGRPDAPADLEKRFDHLIPQDPVVIVHLAQGFHPEATSSQTLLDVDASYAALFNKDNKAIITSKDCSGIDAAALTLLLKVLALYFV